MFSRTMLVHDATTDVICAYSDAVQDAGAEPTAAAAEVVALTTTTEDAFGAAELELVAFMTTTEEETLAADGLVARAADVLETLTEVCIVVATLKQLQALLNLFGFIEQ